MKNLCECNSMYMPLISGQIMVPASFVTLSPSHPLNEAFSCYYKRKHFVFLGYIMFLKDSHAFDTFVYQDNCMGVDLSGGRVGNDNNYSAAFP